MLPASPPPYPKEYNEFVYAPLCPECGAPMNASKGGGIVKHVTLACVVCDHHGGLGPYVDRLYRDIKRNAQEKL